MGKRDSNYYKNKIRKLEERKKQCEQDEDLILCSSPIPTTDTEAKAAETEEINEDPRDVDDELPEEFMLALGEEGTYNKENSEPINNTLAVRWTAIMSNGLGKDARDNITKKYPVPVNFRTSAVAPAMNAEILASLSDLSIKRDKRIVVRQNIVGTLMSCLGKSLSKILKGNINSKELIEEINDAAKLAAEVHYQDSCSRKFFALAGATKLVKESVKDSKIDKYLFGSDFSERIKSAQSVQRTSSQIKQPDSTKKDNNKSSTSKTKQLNWKGPPQYPLPRQQRPLGGQPQMNQYKRQTYYNHHRQQHQRQPPRRGKTHQYQ